MRLLVISRLILFWIVCLNQEMPTGEIEVLAENVEVFNVCQKLPFEMKDFVKVSNLTLHGRGLLSTL